MHCRLNVRKRISVRIKNPAPQTLQVETQRTRARLLIHLEEMFDIASSYARGEVKETVDDNAKERPIIISECQFYARIAA